MGKVVLITGATGKQGGAVVSALLASPSASEFTILAVTRNPDGGAAQKLKERGVKMVKGDLDDAPGVFTEAKNVTSEPIWGVFSVQVPMGNGATPKTEEAQGKAFVDAALANNVKHFVYTSVERGTDSYDNPTNVPHFISKYNVEHHLVDKAGAKGENMGWTILRPVAFMDGFTPDFMGKALATMWTVSIKKEKALQMISVKDIGHFGAQAFIDPEKNNTRAIALAGDSLTFDEASKVYKSKLGTPLPTTFGLVGSAIMYFVGDLGAMFKWFDDVGYAVDVDALRKEYPQLSTFGDWIEKDSPMATK